MALAISFVRWSTGVYDVVNSSRVSHVQRWVRPRCVEDRRCDMGEFCCGLRAYTKEEECVLRCRALPEEAQPYCWDVCDKIFDADVSTCASTKCMRGEKCCNGTTCCAPGTVCCASGCCAPGSACKDGVCVASPLRCGPCTHSEWDSTTGFQCVPNCESSTGARGNKTCWRCTGGETGGPCADPFNPVTCAGDHWCCTPSF
jgi:hypothetical protein